MRALLSTIGSRGDVQPLIALALQLKELGHEAHICAPPDFGEWINSFGVSFTPVGAPVRQAALPSPQELRQLMADTVSGQFEAILPAARDCDVLVAGMSLQFALHSIAERMRIPYVYAAWCPITLPSVHHAPPPLPAGMQPAADADAGNSALWAQEAERWNRHWAAAINSQREKLGLAAISDVRSYIMTDRPLLAADAVLAPWPTTDGMDVLQTGAWITADQRPLSAAVTKFLEAGEPPIYFGMGSMRAAPGAGESMVDAARALGRRAIISAGWAGVAVGNDHSDSIVIEEENLQALFRRVAVVVHHGGAGTTTIAAQAGVSQVVIPQMYDQHYFARRVEALGIGTAHSPGSFTAESLTDALRRTLPENTAIRAKEVASSITSHGARTAAEYLVRRA